MNIKIIGTSHIAKQSVVEIKKAILEEKPDIVAVELDTPRAIALLQNEKRKTSLTDIIQIGIRGYLFAKVGQYAQEKLGKMVGVAPGSDMKAALEFAQQEKLQVALIDQPIKTTLRNISKNLTWREKGQFALDFLRGIVQPKRQLRELGLETFDLRKVPTEQVIEKMMEQLKIHYPSLYKTIVEDRNKYMVRNIIKLVRKDPEKKILVVVGAGHKKGMEELLLKIDVI